MVTGSATPTDEVGSSAQLLWDTFVDALPRVGDARHETTFVGEAVIIRNRDVYKKQRHDSITVLDAAITAVKMRLDHDGIEMPAKIVALQATPSLRAEIHGDADVTPAGSLRRDSHERLRR